MKPRDTKTLEQICHPIKELTVTTAAPPENPQRRAPTPPTLPESQVSYQDVFTLSEGPVVFSWPTPLSKDSYDDLIAWLEIVKRKIGRSVASSGEQT